MPLDLVIRNARLASAAADAPTVDIGVEKGVISAIVPAAAKPGLPAAAMEHDAAGRLVSPYMQSMSPT